MILEILSSSAVGTALGGVFSWLTRVEERKANEMKFAHERGMLELTMKADAAKAEAQLKAVTEAGELAAFGESQKGGFVQTGIKWVDALTGLMRPGLTLLLFIMSCWLAWKLSTRVDGVEGIPTDDAVALWKHMVFEMVFLSSTAMAWWFGARGSSIRGAK